MQGRGRATTDFGRRGRGGAHVKHGVHVRDVGRVKADRLVETLRALARVAQTGHTVRGESCCCAGREAVWARCARSSVQGSGLRLQMAWGTGCGKQRTPNIKRMFVTREVSQLSGWLNLCALCTRGSQADSIRGAGRGLRARRREARRATPVHRCGAGSVHRKRIGLRDGSTAQHGVNMGLQSAGSRARETYGSCP